MSRYRGGSSFIGNLFNQNSELVYFFEPLAVYGHGDDKNVDLKVAFLNQTFHGTVPSYHNAPDATTVYQNEDIINQCKSNGICMWQLSTRFCQPPFCVNENAPMDHCGFACPNLNTTHQLESVQESMDDAMGIAIKTVRIHDVEKLHPLLSDTTLDLKILILIRDPRAIFASRVTIGEREAKVNGWTMDYDDYLNQISIECEQTANGYKWAQQVGLHSQIKYIKFENGVQKPEELRREVYDFIEMNYDEDIMFKLESRLKPNEYQKSVGGAYLSHINDRGANDVIDSWQKKLDAAHVEIILTVCKDVLSIFNYV